MGKRVDVTLSVTTSEGQETVIEFELGGVTMEKARQAVLLLLEEPDEPGERSKGGES